MNRAINAIGAAAGVTTTLTAASYGEPFAVALFAGLTILCTYFVVKD